MKNKWNIMFSEIGLKQRFYFRMCRILAWCYDQYWWYFIAKRNPKAWFTNTKPNPWARMYNDMIDIGKDFERCK